MKKIIGYLLTLVTIVSLAACTNTNNGTPVGGTNSEQMPSHGSNERKPLTLWFWGAEPYAQEAFQRILVTPYNNSQNEYELSIEFRNTVDQDITVALAAGEGPDIVYGSGPAFVMPLAEAGTLENMDIYSEKYGWKDRVLEPYYLSGTVNGSLYSLPNGVNTIGIFYNKKVLADNNWELPTTLAQLETIMDEAMEKGMYASATGNKGWKPVNENYATLFMNHFAGPDIFYNCLTGKEKWNNPAMVDAVNKSAEWYEKGYLGGDDYVNLNFSESIQLLADERTPFFIGPTIGFQWAVPFFVDEKAENLGFMPFPQVDETLPYPMYTLATPCTLSINANSKAKDAAAQVIDMMMSPQFMQEMTTEWPGYWGTPLKDLNSVDTSSMGYMSKTFTNTVLAISDAINSGNFGYYTNMFVPNATQQVFIDIETVWNGVNTAQELLDKADEEFTIESEKGLVPPTPAPGKSE